MFENLLSMKTLSNNMTSALSNAMGNWYPILYNTIGIISIFLQFISFQMKSRKNIIIMSIINSFGWLFYFLLQGDFMSGVSCLLGVLRNVIFLFRGKYKWADSKLCLLAFMIVGGVFSAISFISWKDIFALTAALSGTIAFFMTKEKVIRKISLFTYVAYMCNSISKFYVVALIADVTTFISVIIAMYRYRDSKKQPQAVETEVETSSMD